MVLVALNVVLLSRIIFDGIFNTRDPYDQKFTKKKYVYMCVGVKESSKNIIFTSFFYVPINLLCFLAYPKHKCPNVCFIFRLDDYTVQETQDAKRPDPANQPFM